MSLSGFNLLLGDAAQSATQTNTEANPTGQLIKSLAMPVLLVVVMYVLLFAPQRKRAKEQATMLTALKAGDKIVTSSGIIGLVLSVKEKSVSIRSADTKLEILKSSIAEVTERSGEAGESQS